MNFYLSRYLEQQILDIKTESSFFPEYKDIAPNPSYENQKTNKLKEENEELNNINNMLKIELDKLSKQIELLEKKKVKLIIQFN